MEEHIVVEPEDRYSRLKLIGWWNQQVVRNARVLVVGCGALGNEVLKNLALSGVGHISLIDFDVIEISNLSRSMLFRAGDVRQSKAAVAAMRIREMNPDILVHALDKDIRNEVGLGLYRRFDIIIGCLDNREARMIVNQACWLLGKPWIDGGLDEFMGALKVFIPPLGACYECTLSESDYAALNERYSCSLLHHKGQDDVIPTTPLNASLIGALQVQEALKLLHHFDAPAVQPGSGIFFNGLTNDFHVVRYQRVDSCLCHEQIGEILELPLSVTTTTLRDVFSIAEAYLGKETRLELYRELITAFECPRCHRSSSVFKPLFALKDQDGLCPFCGAECIAVMTHCFYGDEPFLELTLGELGIPPLDILCMRNSEQRLYLECSADERCCFIKSNNGESVASD